LNVRDIYRSNHDNLGENLTLVRRSRAELAYILLDAARRGANKTKMVKTSGLPQKSAERHISMMLRRGLLLERQGLYFVSEKGRTFISEFNKYRQLKQEYFEKLKAVREMIPPLHQIQEGTKT
jgi:predicted transcriptional regulator